jgi:hypothetical protein
MSMPVLGNRTAQDLPDLASVLGHINTAAFLFDDEEKQNPTASPDAKQYLQMNTTDDKFPILVRRDGDGNSVQLSASSAALDLALSQSPGPDNQNNNGWPAYSRHRQAQQSLPTNTLRKGSQVDEYDVGRVNGSVENTPTKNNRRSVEFSLSPYNSESKRSSYHASPSNGMPKLQQSYSTNDVPTLKNGNGANGVNGSGVNSHAEQHFHNHNASIGRIPANAMSNRHSRELSTGFKDHDNAYRPLQSGLHASAAPFGPSITSAPSMNGAATVASPIAPQYSTAPGGNTAPYYGYSVNMLNGAMNGLNMGQPVGVGMQGYNPNGMNSMYGGPPYYSPNPNPYAAYGPSGRLQDSQARVIQTRRMQNGSYSSEYFAEHSLTAAPDANRFMNYDLETMPRAEIYTLCKDQHGCRFLQKKLEERNTKYLEIIFEETAPHVVELMTGMFIPLTDLLQR